MAKFTDRTFATLKPGKHRVLARADKCLWAQVTPTGVKSWLFRYSLNGRAREMGLGPYPDVSLAEAREKAFELRKQVREGIDPIEARNAARAEARVAAARGITFKECAEKFIASHKAGWKNEKHREQWSATLETYVYPEIGSLPVGAIDTPLVTKVLEPLWKPKEEGGKPETAGRVRGRIERILDYAKVQHWRTGENPARWHGHLEHILPKRQKVRAVKHHAAMSYAAVPAFMAELRERESRSARALEFTILTVARTGETIGAEWPEFDLQAKVWTVPGARMKSGKEHRVPLSAAAIRILEEARKAGHAPGPFGALSNMAMLELLRGMRGRGVTVHGFRSSFRDWCAEQTSFPREIAEAALAHVVGGVEGAYQRGDYFEKRRRLMGAWADYLAKPAAKPAAGVVAIREVGR